MLLLRDQKLFEEFFIFSGKISKLSFIESEKRWGLSICSVNLWRKWGQTSEFRDGVPKLGGFFLTIKILVHSHHV
jgi:hypothetical protein